MTTSLKFPGPVVIGGLGGSGTRVIAEIMQHINFYMGSDLNSANDNLWFSLLFKRSKWYIKNSKKKESEIFKALRIFRDIMHGFLGSKVGDFQFIFRAAIECSICGIHFGGLGKSGRGLWPFKRVYRMIRAKKLNSEHIGWGWKEPNTHIYIKYLNEYFDDLKYIHTIRNGLDMAYSRNQAQLHTWGQILNIKSQDNSTPLPKIALEYWIKANENVLAYGKEMSRDRFLMINFEELCYNPRRVINTLLDFLEQDIDHINLDKLIDLVKVPLSTGRYKKQDLSIFSNDEIDTVRKFGFSIDVER